MIGTGCNQICEEICTKVLAVPRMVYVFCWHDRWSGKQWTDKKCKLDWKRDWMTHYYWVDAN